MGFLEGKRALIVGVASPRSIASGVAHAMAKQGAELAFTYQNDKLKSRVEKIAAECGTDPALVFPCDVSDDAQIDAVFDALGKHWYISTGLMPWQYLGQATTPLYDAASIIGNPSLQVVLFIGTMFAAIASANGCINDAARAWFSMGRDRYMPTWFGAIHPHYRTPFRAIIFLIPIAVSFAFTGLLDQVITFSILSGLLGYTFMSINMIKFRKMWPLDVIKRGYIHPFHPIPALTLLGLCSVVYFATFLGYGASLLSIMAFYIVASVSGNGEFTACVSHAVSTISIE